MERPILKLTGKDFLTGIAPSAHSVSGGLFYKAKGVTALASPGATESTDNGLLRAGFSETDYTGSVVVDNIVCGVKDYPDTSAYLYMMGDGGHLYKKANGSGAPTDLAATNQIANPANGINIFQPFGGTKYLYYWQLTQIGRYDLTANNHPAAPDSHWVDNQYTGLQSTTMHPTHRYYNKIFYGNKDRIGSLKDDGAAGVTHTLNALQFPSNYLVTAIADDGLYVVIAITNNTQFTAGLGDTRIIFWDGADTLWTREYHIDEPFILSLTRVGNSVIAQGQRGLYEVTIGGVKKILSRFTGQGVTSSTQRIGPALASTFGETGYMFGNNSGADIHASVDTFGKMSADVPTAYMQPIISDNNKSITFVDAQFEYGKIYVGTTTPKLYAYNTGDNTSAPTGVSAQTVYFPLPTKIALKRIDVVFGEPLISGDSMSMAVFKDEDTASVSFGSATFATDGAIRRKSFYKQITVEDQMSLLITFTAGIPKIKSIAVFGELMTP